MGLALGVSSQSGEARSITSVGLEIGFVYWLGKLAPDARHFSVKVMNFLKQSAVISSCGRCVETRYHILNHYSHYSSEKLQMCHWLCHSIGNVGGLAGLGPGRIRPTLTLNSARLTPHCAPRHLDRLPLCFGRWWKHGMFICFLMRFAPTLSAIDAPRAPRMKAAAASATSGVLGPFSRGKQSWSIWPTLKGLQAWFFIMADPFWLRWSAGIHKWPVTKNQSGLIHPKTWDAILKFSLQKPSSKVIECSHTCHGTTMLWCPYYLLPRLRENMPEITSGRTPNVPRRKWIAEF